jgi:diguanylate cyclase (GGDEF)-like protein
MRATIASQSHPVKKNIDIRITASIGCATYSPKHPFQGAKQLLREADRCLYLAKQRGRNQVVTMDSQAEDSTVEGCA